VRWLKGMGQVLFFPPNVKGWPGGRVWLNTSTILERSNFAAALATGTLWESSRAKLTPPGDEFEASVPPEAFDPARVVEEEGTRDPAAITQALLELYVPGGVRPGAKEKLLAYLSDGKPAGADLERRVRELVHAVLTMPETNLA
jgi:hypothetical protein